VTNAFRALGASIIDADKISKDIVQPGQEALKEIERTFGEALILSNGELNRKQLKQLVFSDSGALQKLEGILHPRIRQEINRQISEHHDEPYIIVDVPLLVEKNYQSMFDRIIVVDCLPEQQIERVLMRDEMDENQIKKIMETQADREERKRFATDIIDNSASIESLSAQIKLLHQSFTGSPE